MTTPKRPTFSRAPVAPPPPAAGTPPSITDLKLSGQAPLPRNQVVMSDWTRQQLQAMGWQEGDPIPGDLGKRIQQAFQEVEQEAATASHNFQPGERTKVGATFDIRDLPATKQAELVKALQTYKQEMKTAMAAQAAQEELEKQIPAGADPSVKAALRSALQAQSDSPQGLPEVSFTRGTPEGSKPTEDVLRKQLNVPDDKVVAGAYGLAGFVTGNPQPTPAQATPPPETKPPATNTPLPEASAGGNAIRERCPRCQWHLSHDFEAHPDEHDKQVFIAGILGCTRFTKTYSLLGGNLQVTYRSLTSREVDLVFQQLRIDAHDGTVITEPEYMMRLSLYRLLMSVERIADGNGAVIAECPPVHEIDGFATTQTAGVVTSTPLPKLQEWFNSDMLPQDSLRRIVAQKHREFQRLVEALEAMTSDEGFWQATAPPR